MELIRGTHNCRPKHHGCVATIGNFDGMHRGHQAIFQQLQQAATEHSLPSCAISFDPLPFEYFQPQATAHRLSTLRDKFAAIAATGTERLLLLRFSQKLAMQPAEDFIAQLLVQKLGVRHLVIGDDFRFGRERHGDFELLSKFGESHGFDVVNTQSVTANKVRVSSSAVREALREGECELATTLLGRPYRISGRVVRGDQVGRQLGYPTANIALKTLDAVPRGVFAVAATAADSVDDQPMPGVANLGERPTVNGKKLLLEVHLFDRDPDLYGQILQVDFLKYLRAEKKFDSLDALKAAISADADAARQHHKL